VTGPAIGLMVVAILNIVFHLLDVVLVLVGVNFIQQAPQGQNGGAEEMGRLVGGVVGDGVAIIFMIIVILGAFKMLRLQSFGLAMTASILAMLPCGPCCLAGIPIGIWALVVLNGPDVKDSFQ